MDSFPGPTAHIDWAQVLLYMFWLFFAGLLFYLQREGRREGYPLVDENTGEEIEMGFWMPAPKFYRANDGRVVPAPDPSRADTRPVAGKKTGWGKGEPIEPTSDVPLADSIGAGAYAERPDIPDLTFEGHDRIVPMRIATDFSIAELDTDPIGLPVFGADGEKVGDVVDGWVDRSEYVLRYLEVELDDAPKKVLVPVNIIEIKNTGDIIFKLITPNPPQAHPEIHVGALLADQFTGAPTTASPDRLTMLEEEKIFGYFGAGYLYATPERQEPLV
ncbi:MAG: photosynthetic reaction center subunit H [Pseudomonadota bacterium]